MTTIPPARLTVRTLTDLIELVPSLLGFHPSDSLVLVVVEHAHIVVTARSDLPHHDAQAVLTQLAPVLRRYPDAFLLSVAYTADPARAWRVLDQLDARLVGRDRRFVHADGSQWFDDPDAVGVAYDATSGVLATQAVFDGVPVRGSRAELAALLEPVADPDDVAASEARLAQQALDPLALRTEALLLLEVCDHGGSAPELDACTLLARAALDDEFLDLAVLTTGAWNAAARRACWLAVLQRAAPGASAPTLCLLGLAAWVSGEGALQTMCLERLDALGCVTEWALFLGHTNSAALPPSAWDDVRADWLTGRLRGGERDTSLVR